jgi:acyl carrier protein
MAPASHGQTRLWFLHQLDPSSPLWNAPSAAWLRGALDVEARIAAIWREILEIDRIGVGDDSFVLGGHSLRATQVLSRIDAAFGVAVALREFFAAPTVRGLAERVREVMSWASALEPTSTSALGAATLEL